MPLGDSFSDPKGKEVHQSPPSSLHPDGRAPHQFHMDLGDLWDAQLWQLMEDLWWEVACRELSVSPGALPWTTGGHQQGVGALIWKMRRLPSWEGEDGDPVDSHHGPLPPSNRGGCWASYQDPCHWVVTGYSKNKYF